MYYGVERDNIVLRLTREFIFLYVLDASKAFDRVHYCKLFRLLIKRGIPACFIRTLVYMYFGHSVRVLWAGILSTYKVAQKSKPLPNDQKS